MVRRRVREDRGMSDRWQPLTIDEVRERFISVAVPWWIAGGHAIDLFIGRVTRPHDDIDVEIFRKDRDALFDVFDGWELFAVSHGGLVRWERGATVAPHVFGVWGRPSADEPWAIEVMLAEGDRALWRFRRDPEITMSGQGLIRTTISGIPFCTPEVQLLYKSKMARPKDDIDMARTLHLISKSQRLWLANAIGRSDPDHPWIKLLDAANGGHHE
jgi:hypothetical protein